MAVLDRAELLSALAKLADADDGVVAAAGRSAAGLIAGADLDWPDVIVPQDTLSALGVDDDDDDEEPVIGVTADFDKAATNDDALLLIGRLLERKNLYEGTREDLVAYKDDIAAGEFDASDLAYLNALSARIMAGNGKSGN